LYSWADPFDCVLNHAVQDFAQGDKEGIHSLDWMLDRSPAQGRGHGRDFFIFIEEIKKELIGWGWRL